MTTHRHKDAVAPLPGRSSVSAVSSIELTKEEVNRYRRHLVLPEVTMSEEKPSQILDIRGKICPYTLLEARDTLKNMSTGGVLEILCDYEPTAKVTIPNFCQKKGYPLQVYEDSAGQWRLVIEKTD